MWALVWVGRASRRRRARSWAQETVGQVENTVLAEAERGTWGRGTRDRQVGTGTRARLPGYESSSASAVIGYTHQLPQHPLRQNGCNPCDSLFHPLPPGWCPPSLSPTLMDGPGLLNYPTACKSPSHSCVLNSNDHSVSTQHSRRPSASLFVDSVHSTILPTTERAPLPSPRLREVKQPVRSHRAVRRRSQTQTRTHCQVPSPPSSPGL